MPQLDNNYEWLPDARKIVSPNYDERSGRGDIDTLVIHGISLPPAEYGGGHIDRLFTNSLAADEHPYFQGLAGLKVSAHILIDRRGAITQYVAFTKRAWHAGPSEFQGRSGCNDFSIGIELEGVDHRPYERSQYLTLALVTDYLVRCWPAIKKDRIVGHSDIAPGRKTDPGPAFDWRYYFSRCAVL